MIPRRRPPAAIVTIQPAAPISHRGGHRRGRFPRVSRRAPYFLNGVVSGEPFVLIPAAEGPGIVGVHSPSTMRPFKLAGFSIENEAFTDATRYSEWRFVFEPPMAAPVVPSGLAPPPPPAGATP